MTDIVWLGPVSLIPGIDCLGICLSDYSVPFVATVIVWLCDFTQFVYIFHGLIDDVAWLGLPLSFQSLSPYG